ncbi:hypothetical protein PTKIN_Ptkin12aG0181400 [Pterospermum kingtungense]
MALMLLNVMSHAQPTVILAFANFGFGFMPQLLVRDMYDALKCACRKLMIERCITINCFSWEGQLAKLELLGSMAFQLLQQTVHPVPCIVENFLQLQKCSIAKDRTTDFPKPDSILDMQEAEANEHHNLTGNLAKDEKVAHPHVQNRKEMEFYLTIRTCGMLAAE